MRSDICNQLQCPQNSGLHKLHRWLRRIQNQHLPLREHQVSFQPSIHPSFLLYLHRSRIHMPDRLLTTKQRPRARESMRVLLLQRKAQELQGRAGHRRPGRVVLGIAHGGGLSEWRVFHSYPMSSCGAVCFKTKPFLATLVRWRANPFLQFDRGENTKSRSVVLGRSDWGLIHFTAFERGVSFFGSCSSHHIPRP
jgi:hypothetical protein